MPQCLYQPAAQQLAAHAACDPLCEQVKAAVGARGAKLELHWDGTLYHLDDLPFRCVHGRSPAELSCALLPALFRPVAAVCVRTCRQVADTQPACVTAPPSPVACSHAGKD